MLLLIWLWPPTSPPEALGIAQSKLQEEPPGGETEPQPEEPLKEAAVPEDDAGEVRSKLKAIAIAFHHYHDAWRMFAPPRRGENFRDGTGLSWRVHLLPFLDQKPLYDRFHLDEPWDSPHNQSLLGLMPEAYRIGSNHEPLTRFQVFTGPDQLFGPDKKPQIRQARDGISNTVLAVAVGAVRAVPWTKPDELAHNASDAASTLGALSGGVAHFAMVDGSVLTLPLEIPPETLSALVTPAGNEIVDAAGLRRQYAEIQGSAAMASIGARPQEPTSGDQTAAVRETPTPQPDSEAIDRKLRRLGAALHNYADTFRGQFPVFRAGPEHTDHFDEQGWPLLSWRVQLLPFLDQRTLYSKFHLDEPWDSPHNMPLLEYMPEIYRTPASQDNKTQWHVISGEKAPFGPNRKTTLGSFRDGSSNTILIVLAGADRADFWTKPDRTLFDPSNPAAVLGQTTLEKIHCVMADGAPLTLPGDIDAETLSALVTPDGGEAVDAGSLRRPSRGMDTDDPRVFTDRQNKMRRIAIAMLNFHEIYGQLPLTNNPTYFDADDRPKLSWRVHLLPYLDQEPLFRQFKLDEPWDSPHNRQLADQMPDVYRDITDGPESHTTRILTFTGLFTPFRNHRGLQLRNFRDGTSNTILFAHAGPDKAVPWTKPEDIVFDADASMAGLGDLPATGFLVQMADGSVRRLKPSLPSDLFKALVTPAGGEEIDPQQLQAYGM